MATREQTFGAICIAFATVIAFGCNHKSEGKESETRELDKKFKLSAKQIKPVAEGYGGCIATDKITVEGHRVHFMYREEADRDVDSGWRFMSGLESDEYMDDASNHGVYDVNTIANYDSDIIPFLDAPIGSAFERDQGTGRFLPVEFSPPKE